ncbi:MAG: hypothetical protein IK092_04460, partial [Muribaculaceae bacterium]|nr:hypothetical protein [Muribaculaceae bacterium]
PGPNYYVVENKDKIEQSMLASFIKSYSKRKYEEYKESAYDVENISSKYRRYAENVILNEEIPDLGNDIVGHDKPVLGVGVRRMLTCNEKGRVSTAYGYPLMYVSSEEQNKRHALEAFMNYEGIDMSIVDEENKSLIEKEKNALSDKIELTLMYMNLLDGLALTSGENQKLALGYLGKDQAGPIGGGAHDVMIYSNYWDKLLKAKDIAKNFKDASKGDLRNKYAIAENKISAWFDNIYKQANTAIDEVKNYRSEFYNQFVNTLLSSGGSNYSISSSPKLSNSCVVHLYFKDGSVVSKENIRAGYTSWSHTEWNEKFETDDNGYVTIRWPEEYKKLNWIIVPFSISGHHLRYQKDDLELTNGGVYEMCLDCD